MKYVVDEKRIYINVSEFVLTAKIGISPYTLKDEDRPLLPNTDNISQKSFVDFCSDGYNFRLICDTASSISFPIKSKNGKPNSEEKSISRGIGYISALIQSAKHRAEADENGCFFSIDQSCDVSVNINYITSDEKVFSSFKETPSPKKLMSFFLKCSSSLPHVAKAEIERVTVRIPSMASAKFPYKGMRQGQSDFIKAAYKTISRGGELFAIAPTGTGKTVSAIYPAVRAIGDGKIEKAFYLTPKTTTAKVAVECLQNFARCGVKLRGIVLSAKDRLCQRNRLCLESQSLCPTSLKNCLTEAVFALFDMGVTAVGAKEINSVANQYNVCPYELALSYSELCDIIICDFNYLFDTKVYIRRFFDQGGKFAFLIDESHNLSDRARQIYSSSLSYDELLSLTTYDVLGEHSKSKLTAKKCANDFKKILLPLIKDEIREDREGNKTCAYHTSVLPSELYDKLVLMKETLEEDIQSELKSKDNEKDNRLKVLREYLYKLDDFVSAIERFDSHYEFFIFYENGFLKAEIFCLDTGPEIRKRLSLGKSSVFFSGTLSPIEYYKEILGGDSTSSVLHVDSPFSPEQLSVCIVSHVSTRFNQRDDTLLDICKYIGATLNAKRGNYMIFSPSFAYCEKLYNAFTAKYPKIKAILQKPDMSAQEKTDFLSEFEKNDGTYLAAFAVTGGIFSEGIDFTGDKLIGAVIVGVGLPTPSFEREAISAYYDEKCESGKLYSYVYPGMNKVLQAAGRVIRCEDDRGVIVLIDDRFEDPLYKKSAPHLWRDMKYYSTPRELNESLKEFWES